jgi:uncharacterized protein YciW
MRHSSTTQRRHTERPKPAAAPTTPLGDNRFQELIRGASAFFAQAERDVVAEKAAAIVEIQALMAEYGLTVADLDAQV